MWKPKIHFMSRNTPICPSCGAVPAAHLKIADDLTLFDESQRVVCDNCGAAYDVTIAEITVHFDNKVV